MIGRRIGRFIIKRPLGEGGMGTVYVAVHEQLGHQVAIKVLHAELSRNPEIAQRFRREALATCSITHHGIVKVHEIEDLPDGSSAIVMEYLDGQSLRTRLNSGPIAVSAAVRIGKQIATALAVVHAKGIIHRDLKPDNIMLVSDSDVSGGERIKILDFGIAKVSTPESHDRTRSGLLIGTPTYMAPEQCRGAAGVGDKADVYSLGVILYQCLSGSVPFWAEGMGDLLLQHLTQEPPPLSSRARAAPAPLAALVHQMLAKDPAARPTMNEVAVRLDGPEMGATDARTPATLVLPTDASPLPSIPQTTLGHAAAQSRAAPRRHRWAAMLSILCVAGTTVMLLLRVPSNLPAPADGVTIAALAPAPFHDAFNQESHDLRPPDAPEHHPAPPPARSSTNVGSRARNQSALPPPPSIVVAPAAPPTATASPSAVSKADLRPADPPSPLKDGPDMRWAQRGFKENADVPIFE